MSYKIDPKTEKPDFTDGDHSFKKWFSIMWKNGYIFLFLVGLIGIIAQIVLFKDMLSMIEDNFMDSTFGGVATIIGMLIPISMCSIIAYKGFYQFWKFLRGK